MKKFLKQLLCTGVILILSTGIVFANDEEEGTCLASCVMDPDIIIEIVVE